MEVICTTMIYSSTCTIEVTWRIRLRQAIASRWRVDTVKLGASWTSAWHRTHHAGVCTMTGLSSPIPILGVVFAWHRNLK